MADKEFEWEIGYSKVHPRVETSKSITDLTEKNDDPLVGQILDGRFLIEKNLTDAGGDVGGIGLVYLATDMKLMGKETVIKILQKSALQSDDIARKFLHEKEALIRLDHPNIVRILDSGNLSDGNPFMVMEYIAGYSLRRVLKEKGKQSFEFTAHVIESVADALNAAHTQKILHRDIKPENIMLTPQEVGFAWVRLIDFGIARVGNSKLAPATEISRGIGTILYIAPEQLLGKMEQTPTADIYALAIVIYEMLTGELPFNPQSVVEMFELQKEGVKIPPSQIRKDLPPEAEKILLSALAFNSEERPQNIWQFGCELAHILRGNPVYQTNERNDLPQLDATIPANHFLNQMSVKTDKNPVINQNPSIVTIDSTPNRNSTILPELPQIVSQTNKRPDKFLLSGLIGVLILAVIVTMGGILYWTNSGRQTAEIKPQPPRNIVNGSTESNKNDSNTLSNSTATTEPTIELTYHLIVQKMRSGKSFEAPFRSSGQEIFENDYKFRLGFQSQSDGFVYLFNQDIDEQGKNFYNILYPTPKTNNGSAQVFTNQQIETSENTFGGSRGTEIIWLIWTADKLDFLESIKQSAFSTKGIIADEKSLQELGDFFQKNKDRKKVIRKNPETQETVIQTNGNVLLHNIELEHR